ncbi:hypothetical protein [Paracidobacterium acidisoli]|uniref:Outer membrane protein beta-barrel domain-containing protein n=1 Tax=Paracidobacterium acidisoli TaxID=2303751 RepID=A0A372IRD6_9BACT|nr:hypothetical protein [Paracidobacterium acidisoli]MBT9330352.1 hypothetical protein [Paracidobacterium acidisoli]
MRGIYLVLCGLLLLPLSGLAQTGIYATFSASDYNLPNVDWQYGPTVGLYHEFGAIPFLGVGFDVRAQFLGSGSSQIYSGLLGPRVSLHPHLLPVKPYVEALGGAGDVNVGEGVANASDTAFEYQLVAGADVTIFPRIDWRVAEFSYGGFANLGENLHPRTLGTGIVIRLP